MSCRAMSGCGASSPGPRGQLAATSASLSQSRSAVCAYAPAGDACVTRVVVTIPKPEKRSDINNTTGYCANACTRLWRTCVSARLQRHRRYRFDVVLGELGRRAVVPVDGARDADGAHAGLAAAQVRRRSARRVRYLTVQAVSLSQTRLLHYHPILTIPI